jgi:hypothetical protein
MTCPLGGSGFDAEGAEERRKPRGTIFSIEPVSLSSFVSPVDLIRTNSPTLRFSPLLRASALNKYLAPTMQLS